MGSEVTYQQSLTAQSNARAARKRTHGPSAQRRDTEPCRTPRHHADAWRDASPMARRVARESRAHRARLEPRIGVHVAMLKSGLEPRGTPRLACRHVPARQWSRASVILAVRERPVEIGPALTGCVAAAARRANGQRRRAPLRKHLGHVQARESWLGGVWRVLTATGKVWLSRQGSSGTEGARKQSHNAHLITVIAGQLTAVSTKI